MRGRARCHLAKVVCAALLLSGAWLIGGAGAPAHAASKLDVCALLPIPDASAIAGQPVVVNLTELPSFVTKQKVFLGHCEWSCDCYEQLDASDPPLFLPSVTVTKYSAKAWKQQIKSETQGGATSVKKIKIVGASKAVQLTADCPPLVFDKVLMRVGKRTVLVQVGAYHIMCPPPHAPDFAKVVASNL